MSPRGSFWNAQERRLRAGWRLVLQAVSFLIILIVVALLPKAIDSRLGVALAALFVYPVGVLASVKMFARHVDGRPFAEIGLRRDGEWWRDLGFGLLLGAFMLTGVFVTRERPAS